MHKRKLLVNKNSCCASCIGFLTQYKCLKCMMQHPAPEIPTSPHQHYLPRLTSLSGVTAPVKRYPLHMFYIHLSTARSLHSTTTAYSCENRANGGFVDVFAVQRGTTMIQWLWPLGSERYVGGWLNHVACGRRTHSLLAQR